MSRYRNIFFFFLCTLLLWPPDPASAQNARVVDRIEITSTWSELAGGPKKIHKGSNPSAPNEPASTHLVIHKGKDKDQEKDKYYLADKVVDTGLIAALAKALSAPPNPELKVDDLGVTAAWLKAHDAAVVQHFAGTRVNGAPIHAAMLEATFADPVTVNKVVPSLFDKRHYVCADCSRPVLSVKVVVSFDDFTNLEAKSSSPFPDMLPWQLSGTATEATAYNADISRSIAALMPQNSTNRSRLSGEDFAIELGGAVMTLVERQAQLLDVEGKTGGTFHELRSRYSIESASIDNFEDPVLRAPEATAVDAPEGQNLHLLLQVSDPPHNFFQDEVALPFTNGNVVGADKFLQDGPQFEKLVLSVPWLNHYAQAHPDVRFRLSFVHSTSFSDVAIRVFAADMHESGRDKVTPEVEAAKGGVALLVVGVGAEESDWLVFPDQHMVLWRFFQSSSGKTSLLKWGPASFAAKPCAKLRNNSLHCVGAEISPDGKLQHAE
jgi:hypothetical protein